VTLIELVVALAVLPLLLAIGAITARRALSTQALGSAADARAVAISDALQTLARHASDADPANGDLVVARDTTLQLRHDVGITSVCRSSADTLVTSTGSDAKPWSSTLLRLITDDDQVRLWHEPTRSWILRSVRTATPATGACGDSITPWPERASQRLLLNDSIPGMLVGAPVRVLQRERWSLVRGGDGNWSLALATWNEARASFNVPQPLLSPLAAPSARDGPGFSARAITATGATLADSALTRTRSIIAVIRSTTHPRLGNLTDSVRINVRTH
jgi:type II secretory pathway pseudopilin PulG